MSQPPSTNLPGRGFHVSGLTAVFLAAVILAPWAVVWWWRSEDRRADAPATNTVVQQERRIQRCRPGPWGELEYTRILIEPPLEYIPTQFDNIEPVRWVLPAPTPAALGLFLATVPLTEAERRELLAPERCERTASDLIVKPSQEFILGLNPETRAALYTALGKNSANVTQFRPARFRAEASAEWFADSGLSPATVALVEKFVYRRGNALLFADQATVLPLLESDTERSRLIKTLARKAALLVNLRLRPGADIDALVRYWSPATRAKDIEPLLRSLPKTADGFLLDVVHLLPRFARMRLYTYQEPRADADTVYTDCHWSSFNFFAATPDDRFSQASAVAETLAHDYYRVPGETQFGDVIMFVRPDGSAIHSCVYIADDIVFTKNGGDTDIPWILMQMADLLPWYAADGPVEVRSYRRRRE